MGVERHYGCFGRVAVEVNLGSAELGRHTYFGREGAWICYPGGSCCERTGCTVSSVKSDCHLREKEGLVRTGWEFAMSEGRSSTARRGGERAKSRYWLGEDNLRSFHRLANHTGFSGAAIFPNRRRVTCPGHIRSSLSTSVTGSHFGTSISIGLKHFTVRVFPRCLLDGQLRPWSLRKEVRIRMAPVRAQAVHYR